MLEDLKGSVDGNAIEWLVPYLPPDTYQRQSSAFLISNTLIRIPDTTRTAKVCAFRSFSSLY